MTDRSRAAAIVFALVVAIAEIVRPTHPHAKKIASRALLVHPQSEPGGVRDSLDPELLDDLPRIFPDAQATIATLRQAGGGTVRLEGRIDDPFERAPGLAVFPIVDGARDARATIHYDAPASDAFSVTTAKLAPGVHTIGIGVVTADQRGCFLGPTMNARVSPA